MTDKVTTVGLPIDFKTKALEIAYAMTSSGEYGEGKAYADARAKHIRQLVEIMTSPSKATEETEVQESGTQSFFTG